MTAISMKSEGRAKMAVDRGYIQIYTGDGKGKTTAALGLALRACGAGLRVYFGQFIKDGDYSEIKALRRFPEVCIEQYGAGLGFIRSAEDKAAHTVAAHDGLKKARQALINGEYDVVILDEINVAVSMGVLDIGEQLNLMELKPVGVELIMTGRGAAQAVIAKADLVTEMREIKHYYQQGVEAREGIEK